ncbi:MAG: translation initiation factor IF-2, partial [Chloroflexi bacterium]
MKSHELARELGISQKELVNFLQQRRMPLKNAAAPLAPSAIEAARSAFKPTSVAVKMEANGDRKAVLPPTLSVKDLAEKLGVSPVEVIKKLMASKILATINQVIDFSTAEIVADEFGFTVEPVKSEDVVAVESSEGAGDVVTTSREELFSVANEDPTKLVARPPIVTVLGHVDHGKTSILDAIRKTRVAAGEAGGITQRIGAYKIETADGHEVVFIDTPGHEAFTAMRARGAQVTDLVVLVVAADDGVMPQTIEAIHHARAAKVPIIVAINKIDKDNANPDRVHQELAAQGLVTRHYGGELECVHLSAKTGRGIDDLLTTIVLSSDILELKANPDRNAIGTVVDAHLERGRGPVATVLVQAGTLKVGDDFVCGHIYGRVRALTDDRGQSVTEAPPATPVVVSGMSEVPQAGDIFQVVGSEKAARQIALTKLTERRTTEAARD